MSSLTFEGDLSGLSVIQQQFIREAIEREGFNNNKVFFEPVGKTGDNYVASVKRITILTSGMNDVKIIVKIAPRNEALRSLMNTDIMFSNEVIMYEKILPKFTLIEESAGVPKDERFKYAKCYGCLLEAPNELIMLEDLTNAGYFMLDRMIPLEKESVKLFLKNFALLHSLSFVLKHFEPETFEEYKNSLKDMMIFMSQTEDFRKTYAIIADNTVAIVDDDYKQIVREISSQWFTFFDESKKSADPAHLIIQQGDAWTNNIMFKSNDEKLEDAIMIDYQLSRAANPAFDILFMIFICTDHVSRSKHYHDWMNYYHEKLDKSLTNFGLKSNTIYSKSQLDADLKKYSKYFFGFTLFMTSMTMRTDDEAALVKETLENTDVMDNNMSVGNLSENTINLMRSKIVDMVDSYREFGYLDN